jgi:hypothetical protein
VLNLHSPLSPEGITSEDQLPRCELISISTGHAHYIEGVKDLGLQDCEDQPRKGPYEFYNVLWIEWEDGIAYRKGVGRVEKNMWEAQPLERIDVTLG